MSEFTPTNKETLARIRAEARAGGQKVTILHDGEWGMGGMNVYVHPKEVDVSKMPGGEDGPRAQFRRIWFMAL